MWHGHAPFVISLVSLAKYNHSIMPWPSTFKLGNSVAMKGNEALTLFERAYPNPTGSPQSEEDLSYTGTKLQSDLNQ